VPASPVSLADIERAAERLAGRIERTPTLRSLTLSEITGAELWLKFENLQYTASFKERGAYTKLASLDAGQRARGVVAMSAGNHAQGVAYHARLLGIPATIVMPKDTPSIKIGNTRRLGARVLLEGAGFDEAAEFAGELARKEQLTFVHPFDDPLIIAGQGTVALEMLADAPDLEVLVVPIGGGGLISGIATAAKALRPDLRIVGVQTRLFPSVHDLLEGGEPDCGGPTIAEGIAVKTPGRLTMPIIRELVDEVLLVEEAHLEEAVLRLLEIEKSLVEGAGAAGLAAIGAYSDRFRGRRVGIVLTGGNIDMRLLSGVILRGLARSDRLVRLRVGLPDSPGSLARVATVIGEGGGNVVDVQHQRAFSRRGVKEADVDLTIETRDAAHAASLLRDLVQAGYSVAQLDRS
jgi:threonine dehydratase